MAAKPLLIEQYDSARSNEMLAAVGVDGLLVAGDAQAKDKHPLACVRLGEYHCCGHNRSSSCCTCS